MFVFFCYAKIWPVYLSSKLKIERVGVLFLKNIMRKIKFLGLGSMMLVGSLLMTNTVEARKHSGNYINSAGCLVVWESTTFLGITWSYSETVFCNDDGSPVVLGD